MSKLSEQRVIDEVVERVSELRQKNRERDLMLGLVTFGLGLIGNFLFSRVQFAALIWLLTVWAAVDFVCTFRPLSRLMGLQRIALQLLLLGLVLAVSFPFIRSEYRSQHAAELSGFLRARSDGRDHTGDLPILQIGDGGSRLRWGGPNGYPMLKKQGEEVDKITIRRTGNELKFSTTVRDKSGNLIVEIRDNEWRVSPDKSVCWDKNYNEDSLEVKDGRGRVVLQVRLLPDAVQLQVEWPQGGSGMTEQGMYDPEDGIKPRFKYPSDRFWGEVDTSSGYTLE